MAQDNVQFQPLPLSSPPPTAASSPPLPPTPTPRITATPSLPSRLNPFGGDRRSMRVDGTDNSTPSSSDESSGNRPFSYTYGQHSRRASSVQLDPASVAVMTGAVGGAFGPFPPSTTYSPAFSATNSPFNHRDSLSSSEVGINLGLNGDSPPLRNSRLISELDLEGRLTKGEQVAPMNGDYHAVPKSESHREYLWDQSNAEADDYIHEPDAVLDRMLDKQWHPWNWKGWFETAILLVLVVALVGLFAGWPIYNYVDMGRWHNGALDTNLGWNIGGINGSGQVPSVTVPGLIDATTPQSAYTRTGFDGETYNLVFSDEFNTDGRTFWPGDDPWWEAVNLHYWATADYEWYDPDAITTQGGNLVITLSEQPIGNLNFRSGMLQSWNKFCFTGGYIEARMSMPGSPKIQGFWPGAWTMGNLGRPGYGASVDGVWPYSYSACDVGTMPNQSWVNGTGPAAAKHSGSHDYGGELSYLAGQRLSACTCPGEDHPGPNNGVGRGAPEIDIIEGQVDYRGVGSASQSIQVAPMDSGYNWQNSTTTNDFIQIWNSTGTFQNTWHGSVNQESLSVITLADETSYEGNGYTTYGFEYDPGSTGRITWAMNASQTWQLNAAAIGPNADTEISQRLISQEPMSINLNLAISHAFQTPEWAKLTFPAHFMIDYVRVYQKGKPNIGCDPPGFPTVNYINNHPDIYNNANLTTFKNAGYTMPKNSFAGEC